MSGTVMPSPIFTALDSTGVSIPGAQLFCYAAGTTTKLDTYTTAALTTPNSNPVVCDAAGRAVVYLSSTSYKFVLAPADDTDPPTSPIWTQDNISAVPPTGSATDNDIAGTAGENLTAGDVCYLSDGSGSKTAGTWYKASGSNTYSSSAAHQIGLVTTDVSTGSAAVLRLSGRVTGLSGLVAGTLYYISDTAGALDTAPTNYRPVGVADSASTFVVSPWALGAASSTGPGFITLTDQTLGAGTKTVGGLVSGLPPTFNPGTSSTTAATANGPALFFGIRN